MTEKQIIQRAIKMGLQSIRINGRTYVIIKK